MSETLKQKPFETNHENLPGAAEVFASGAELERASREAVEQGKVETRLFTETDGKYPDINGYFTLEANDLNHDFIQEHQYISGRLDELPLTDEAKVIERVKYEAEERLVERVFHDNNWHIGEPLVEREIEANTPLSQRFSLELEGSNPIEVMNFSDTQLSEDQQDKIRQIVSGVTAVAGKNVFTATNAIIFTKSDRFKGGTIGTARGASGVILLNESLINGAVDEQFKKFEDIDVTPMESTLTHELAHLVELQDTVNQAYGEATGWKKHNTDTVDDYGEVVSSYKSKLEMPWEITVADEVGVKESILARDRYELSELTSAKPVTGYGYTNEREDLAEAFVPYIHAKGSQQLDRIRKDSLDSMMRRINNEEHGPHQVTMRPIALDKKIGLDIWPQTYTVGEPQFSYSPPVTERQTPKLSLEEQQKQAYSQRMAEVVDDYGNVVTASQRSVSRW